MFSLFACTSAFCYGTVLISDVTTLVSASLGTLRTKRTRVSKDSGVMGSFCASRRKVRREAQNSLVQAKRQNMQCGPTTRCLISEDPNTKKHCCGNHKSHIKPAVSQDGYTAVVMPNMWRQCYMRMYWYKPLDKQTNVKLPTVLLYIEFNTPITMELLTNYTDPISAGISHNCGHKSSSRIVNVVVDMCVMRLLCNTYHT